YFIYAGMMYEPLNRLHGLNHMLAAATASGKRVFEVLDHPVDIVDAEHPIPFPTGSLPHIEYRAVDFAYTGRSQVLHRMQLQLPPGKMTALVGHTGAGKSTIANLLLRYYDVTGGAVTINGVDVRSIALKDLRSHIGYVAQDPFLF
ncbi:MAG: ABC transporter ATP-binding protein/permease, partial [Verrucomicrobia bacterium]|nr:ABC transporter ATP-binding protein/permease [Verrucomicrobiota bacterium]